MLYYSFHICIKVFNSNISHLCVNIWHGFLPDYDEDDDEKGDRDGYNRNA